MNKSLLKIHLKKIKICKSGISRKLEVIIVDKPKHESILKSLNADIDHNLQEILSIILPGNLNLLKVTQNCLEVDLESKIVVLKNIPILVEISYNPLFTGIYNLGSTCFMNTALQALSVLRNVSEYKFKDNSGPLISIIKNLNNYSPYDLSKKTLKIKEFRNLFISKYPKNREGDALEFLIDLICSQETGFIDIFRGKKIQYKKCLGCTRIITTKEDFLFLNLTPFSFFRIIVFNSENKQFDTYASYDEFKFFIGKKNHYYVVFNLNSKIFILKDTEFEWNPSIERLWVYLYDNKKVDKYIWVFFTHKNLPGKISSYKELSDVIGTNNFHLKLLLVRDDEVIMIIRSLYNITIEQCKLYKIMGYRFYGSKIPKDLRLCFSVPITQALQDLDKKEKYNTEICERCGKEIKSYKSVTNFPKCLFVGIQPFYFKDCKLKRINDFFEISETIFLKGDKIYEYKLKAIGNYRYLSKNSSHYSVYLNRRVWYEANDSFVVSLDKVEFTDAVFAVYEIEEP